MVFINNISSKLKKQTHFSNNKKEENFSEKINAKAEVKIHITYFNILRKI
jgi:hypothetical protein